MKLADIINEACKTHDIYDVLGVNRRKRTMICPLPQHIHHHNTPSFSVFWKGGKQWWKCHGSCNVEGDIVDLIGFMRLVGYNKRNKDMVREALSIIDERFDVKIVLPPPEIKRLSGSEWMDFIPPGTQVIEYAKSRGLEDATIQKFRIGQKDEYMSIPSFQEGRLMGIKFRSSLAKPRLRYFTIQGSRQTLFNYDRVYLTNKPVLIVKGEIPSMLLDQMGYLSCAPTSGEGGWLEDWRMCLALAQKIVIGDNDKVGRELGEKRAAFFGAKLVFPDVGKDIDEFILADRELAKMRLNQWIEEAQ